METSPCDSRRRDETEFNLREWGLKACVGHENSHSRRFSASYIRSSREETQSFRSNFTISSTASSPGYPLKDEIDPSTYSFTTALKALQARSAYNTWECVSLDGFTLNSKWNEAEKYICNPLSGEVPVECLSAKTLSARSFSNFTNRIAMSAPLVYSSKHIKTKPSLSTPDLQFPIPEKKTEGMTRDVGTQSTPPYLSSSTPTPASTPPIIERTLKRCEESPNSNTNLKSQQQAVEVKETGDYNKEETELEKKERKKKMEQDCRQGGCFSWVRNRKAERDRTRKNYIFLTQSKGC